MKKKIISAIILCLCLCGCSHNQKEPSSETHSYHFTAGISSVETKQEKIESAVTKYVKSLSSIYGTYDSISIGSVKETGDYEYTVSGKYWVKDDYGDKHRYTFTTKVTYISGEAKISSYDFKDWKEY